MADTSKPQAKNNAGRADSINAMATAQTQGFGNVMQIGTGWLETMSGIGAEMLGFVADRIKEDVKTQHDVLQCKNIADLQLVQAQFLQRSIDQYRAETGKLVEMNTRAFDSFGAAGKAWN